MEKRRGYIGREIKWTPGAIKTLKKAEAAGISTIEARQQILWLTDKTGRNKAGRFRETRHIFESLEKQSRRQVA